MKNTASRAAKSCVAMLLVLCMVMSLPLSALAATKPSTAYKATENAFDQATNMDVNGDGKVTYVSFGDSVTNGYGLKGYRYEDGTNPYGFLQQVEGGYPDLIRDALEAQGYTVDLQQMAISGYRIDEVHSMLDDNYVPDSYHEDHYKYWNSHMVNAILSKQEEKHKEFLECFEAAKAELGLDYVNGGDGVNNRKVADRTVQKAYRAAVNRADLITLSLGTNNFGTFLTMTMQKEMGMADSAHFDVDFRQYMDENTAANLEMVLREAVKGMVGADNETMADLTYAMMECLIYGYLSFTEHYDATIKRIYEMNPKAKVVVIDMYTMISGVDMRSEKLGDKIDIDGIYNMFVDAANLYTRELSPYAHKVTHVTLDTDPELCIDYFADYTENREKGEYADSQYLHPVAEGLLNDLVCEMLGYNVSDPAQVAQFRANQLKQIQELDGIVNDVQNVVKNDVVVKEIVPGIKDAIYGKDENDAASAVFQVNLALKAVDLVNLAVEGVGKMQTNGKIKDGLISKAALGVKAAQGKDAYKNLPEEEKDAFIVDYLMSEYGDLINHDRTMAEMACVIGKAYNKAESEGKKEAERIKDALAAVLNDMAGDMSALLGDMEASELAEIAYGAVEQYNDTWLTTYKANRKDPNAEAIANDAAFQVALASFKPVWTAAGMAENLDELVYEINKVYNEIEDKEAAMDAAILTGMKSKPEYAEGTLAESIYYVAKSAANGDETGKKFATDEQHREACIYALTTKELKDTASGELRYVTLEESTAIYNCYAGGYNGKFDDETVQTALTVLMVLDERFTNLADANASYVSYLTYKNLPKTLEKISKCRVMFLEKVMSKTGAGGTTSTMVSGMKEKIMNGTLRLEEPKAEDFADDAAYQAAMDEFQQDATLSVMYFRFLSQDGVFTHPSLGGAAHIASLTKKAMQNLLVEETDSEIQITSDSKLLVLGDFVATNEGYVNTLAKNLKLKDGNVTNLSNPKFRVDEVRALLDSAYTADAYGQAVLEGIDSETYVNAVQDSDVILVHLGSMNMGLIMEQLYAAMLDPANPKTYSMRYGSLANMAVRDLGNRADRVMDRLQGMVQGENADMATGAMMLIFKTYNYGLISFADCLDATVEKIQELNPNANIVLVGQYDLLGSYNTLQLTDNQIHLEFGEFIDDAQRRMNDQMQIYAQMTDNVTYVDVYSNYEGVGDLMGETNAFQRVPDAAGYAEMAAKISCHLGTHTAASADAITWGEWVKTDEGYTRTAEYDCGYCGVHASVDALVTSEITKGSCVEDGTKTYTAYVPGYTTQTEEKIVGGEHTPGAAVEENRVESTCTVAGSYEEVVKCSACGEELSRTTKTLELAAHTPGTAVKENEKAATCGEDGSYDEVIYCTVEGCKKEISRVKKTLPKTGAHTPSKAVKENVVSATCTAAGSYEDVVRCTGCQSVLSSEKKTIDKIPHTAGKPSRDKEVAATCAKAGSYEEVVNCSICKAEMSRTAKVIPQLTDHTPGKAVKENEKEATCQTGGSYDEAVYCTGCNKELSRTTKKTDKLNSHTPETVPGKAPTCTASGLTDGVRCKHCGGTIKVQSYIPAKGHTPKEVPGTDATCTAPGMTAGTQCAVCKLILKNQQIIPAKGHTFADGKCSVCGAPESSEPQPSEPQKPAVTGVNRVYGSNRWNTAFQVADLLKQTQGIEKFPAVVVANGNEFADALAGTYLATQKNIPILVTHVDNDKIMGQVQSYITENLATKGTIYVLGGEKAVDPKFDKAMEANYTVVRLAGSNRYKTNIEVLKASGLTGGKILVATGRNFADSLSASATGLPILMVHGNVKLQDYQTEYLTSLGTQNEFYILGGVNAVSEEVAEGLKAYGTVNRIEGKNRYETSVKIAETFFTNPTNAVAATGTNFADGLCGGILAYNLKAPLILTASGRETIAAEYLAAKSIQDGYILGGTAAVADKTGTQIFATDKIIDTSAK